MNLQISIGLWIAFCRYHVLTSGKNSDNANNKQQKYPGLVLLLKHNSTESSVTACPASTEREMKFNDEVSITGRSLFLQKARGDGDNSLAGFCDKPLEPATVYNLENRKYEIGYELYYEQKKDEKYQLYRIFPKIISNCMWWQNQNYTVELADRHYHHYKLVDADNQIVTQSKLLNARRFVVSNCQNRAYTTFVSNDGDGRSMAFYWIPDLRISSKACNKQISIEGKSARTSDIRSSCEDYLVNKTLPNLYAFSKNHKKKKNSNRIFESWKKLGKPYSNMTLSQIIPIWYFRTAAAKMASCSPMNRVPIHTSIAEGQLKKVDLYLEAIARQLSFALTIKGLTFGVCGMLTLRNGSTDDEELVYLSDNAHRQVIPVPKIIYRVIETEHDGGIDPTTAFSAVVVIHNDPTGVSDGDRICAKDDQVDGWNKITNNDSTTGITYVCPCRYEIKKQISNRMGVCVENDYQPPVMTRPLELNRIRLDRKYNSFDTSYTDYNYYQINKEFQNIVDFYDVQV